MSWPFEARLGATMAKTTPHFELMTQWAYIEALSHKQIYDQLIWGRVCDSLNHHNDRHYKEGCQWTLTRWAMDRYYKEYIWTQGERPSWPCPCCNAPLQIDTTWRTCQLCAVPWILSMASRHMLDCMIDHGGAQRHCM